KRGDNDDRDDPATSRRGGFDLFLFPAHHAGRLAEMPYGIGDPWWDLWVPFALAASGLPVQYLAMPIFAEAEAATPWGTQQWLENGRMFWADLRKWRSASPSVFIGLDDEFGRLWDTDELSENDLFRLASRAYRWLLQHPWLPESEAFAHGPSLLRAFQSE